eukprot:2042175-Alexandrium_andersonii.AAC.1
MVQAGTPEEERVLVAAQELRADLSRWYRKWRKDHPGAPITEVQDLTASMLGTTADRKCALKGAEPK